MRIPPESQRVDHCERLTWPRERNRVRGHEEQVGVGPRQSDGKSHLRPKAWEWRDHEVDAKTRASPRREEPPLELRGRSLKAGAQFASENLGARNHFTGGGVEIYCHGFHQSLVAGIR